MSSGGDVYEVLAQFRHGLRGFLRFSEQVCERHGCTPALYQLMLVLKTADVRGRPVDIGNMANALGLKHHSAAELVHRAAALGLVDKASDPDDARRTLVALSEKGRCAVRDLAVEHIAELKRIRVTAFDVLARLDDAGPPE
jgi:DNA-binding MarR family transcriptional regulator